MLAPSPQGVKSDWIRHTQNFRCHTCNGPDNCESATVGNKIFNFCGRRVDGALKINAGGQGLYVYHVDEVQFGARYYENPNLRRYRMGSKPAAPSTTSSTEKASKKKPTKSEHTPPSPDDGHLRHLAARLGVSVDSLAELSVSTTYGVSQWPERNADGAIIGVSTRNNITGNKRLRAGGNRGLYYSRDGFTNDGPICIGEGGSDTASLLTMKIDAVGVPSVNSGTDLLAERLADVPADREITRLGERDPENEDGVNPGRDFSRKATQELANRLNRPILWSFVGDGAKDVREWIGAHGAHREAFLAGLECETIHPNGDSGDEPIIDPEVEEEVLEDNAAGRHKPNGHVDSCECPSCQRGGHLSDCCCDSCCQTVNDELQIRRQSCNYRRNVWDATTSEGLFVSVACERWSCPRCRKKLIQQWADHLGDVFANKTEIFRIEVATSRQAKTTIQKIRRAGGLHARIRQLSNKIVIFSSVKIAGSERLTGKEGNARVRQDVSEIVVQNRPISTSRPWAKQKKPSNPNWKAIDGDWRSLECMKDAAHEMGILIREEQSPSIREAGIIASIQYPFGWTDEDMGRFVERVKHLTALRRDPSYSSHDEYMRLRFGLRSSNPIEELEFSYRVGASKMNEWIGYEAPFPWPG